MNIDNSVGIELPKYVSHKEVWALKIKEVHTNVSSFGFIIVPEDARYAGITVSQEWGEQHRPQSGGYYVVYKDGYMSYSPAAAFEEGYTKIS